MISDPKNLSEQLCNLSERLGIEMRTLNRTKVSTVNGLIPDNSGAITVDVGVTSFNGSKGAVTYTAPVTSVNGQTGAVSVDVGVKTVNGTQPDSSGNVTIEVSGGGGDTSNLVPKTGNRGVLAGYNTCGMFEADGTVTELLIDENTPDDFLIYVTDKPLKIGFSSQTTAGYVKNILLACDDPSLITFWFDDMAFVDTFFKDFVNDLDLSGMDQIVVTGYGDTVSDTQMVFVSLKTLTVG